MDFEVTARVRGTICQGVRFREGTPEDWAGHLERYYSSCELATKAARRKFQDNSINVMHLEQVNYSIQIPYGHTKQED